MPYFLKMIVDDATRAPAMPPFHLFLFPVVAIGVLLLACEICFRVAHICEIYITTSVFERITNDLYSRILKRPTSYFEDKLSGDLGRRIQQVGTASVFFVELFPWQTIWVVLALVSAGVLLAITHVYLLYTFLAWSVLFIGSSIPLLRWSHRLSQEVASAHAGLSGTIVDTFGNVPLVHAFGAVSHEQSLHRATVRGLVGVEKRTRWANVSNKFQEGISIVVLATALVVVSVYLFTIGELTVGGFVIVAAIIPQLTGAIWNLGEMIMHVIREFGELSDAVHSLQASDTELVGGAVSVTQGPRDLVFEDVGFRYPGTSTDVFAHFSLHIREGERVGIVGASGAGKSTLIKLLLRQYEPQQGIISLGGVPVGDLTLDTLRTLVSYVPQDTSLFHRTLFENIHYARPSATRDEVLRASEQAHAHEFIAALPQGYDTKVGERGVKLSGGQRQRIALARAILKAAPILVLDEATSALDSESEALVQDGLQELFARSTVVAIAHRLSTLRAMDRIIVMEQGTILESGSPQALLATEDGIFKRMWEHQKHGFV